MVDCERGRGVMDMAGETPNERPDKREASASDSSSEWRRCSPAEAHHMKPEYASADQESGSTMSSVSGRSSIGSSRGEEVRRGGSGSGIKSEFPRPTLGEGGGEMCRDNPHRRALYRHRSRCVAFNIVPCGHSTFGHTFSAASSE